MQNRLSVPKDDAVHARQIAFVAAFILPTAKFLEVPSLLARFGGNALLLPALGHFLLQGAILAVLLFVLSRSPVSLEERLRALLGRAFPVLCLLYALYFVYAALLPLLDMEKFVYAAFFDSAPTAFSFGTFFLVSAFACVKGLSSVGRCGDLCLFLVPLPFLLLLAAALPQADFSNLLPLFSAPEGGITRAFCRSFPHFSDTVLLLPLLLKLRHQKGDGKKILGGYAVGALSTLLFLAFFYAVFSVLAPREHYAFSKIAQYFSAWKVVGRLDFLFVYLLTIALIFYTCLPLQYAVELVTLATPCKNKIPLSFFLNLALFLFVLFFNRHYDAVYAFVTKKAVLVFPFIADTVLLFSPFLIKKPKNKEKKVC